jgi:hypothetical protein
MMAATGPPSVLSSWTARKITSPSTAPRKPRAYLVADMALSGSDLCTNLEETSDLRTPVNQPRLDKVADGRAGAKRCKRVELERAPAAVTVAFDLGSLEWKQHQDSRGGSPPVPKGCSLAAALEVLIAQKGSTTSMEAANTWVDEQLLASGGIRTRSELCDVESAVTAAVRVLQGMALIEARHTHWEWAQHLPPDQQWCVGGSVLATYEARIGYGCAQSLVLVTCRRGTATASHVASAPGTCEGHCVVRLDDVMVGGQWWQTLQLKKCSWACCARSRPFASPPEIPWRAGQGICSCAQQKSFDAMEDQTPAVGEPSGCTPGALATTHTEQTVGRTLQLSWNSPPVQPAMPPKKN